MIINVWHAREDAHFAHQLANFLGQRDLSVAVREFTGNLEPAPRFGDLHNGQFLILASPELARSGEFISWFGELLKAVENKDYSRHFWGDYSIWVRCQRFGLLPLAPQVLLLPTDGTIALYAGLRDNEIDWQGSNALPALDSPYIGLFQTAFWQFFHLTPFWRADGQPVREGLSFSDFRSADQEAQHRRILAAADLLIDLRRFSGEDPSLEKRREGPRQSTVEEWLWYPSASLPLAASSPPSTREPPPPMARRTDSLPMDSRTSRSPMSPWRFRFPKDRSRIPRLDRVIAKRITAKVEHFKGMVSGRLVSFLFRAFWGRGTQDEKPKYEIVEVFFATDRGGTGASKPSDVFGKSRSILGILSFGICAVSIPRTHRVGVLEAISFWKLEAHPNPDKHVVLLRVEQQDSSEFYRSVKNKVFGTASREALVFVHGYNVTFEDAARRTAQLAYDLQFEGAPIFYSWPSQGELPSYTVDETNAEWSEPHLARFLQELAQQVGARTVHLIAHSMGNRVLSNALRTVATEGRLRLPAFRHIVLTAPDIDADVMRHLASYITKTAERTTLYMCGGDKALVASRQFHGNPRAGDSVLIMAGVDTIDASAVDTSFLGHSYFGDSRPVLADLFCLLKQDLPPAYRFGMSAVTKSTEGTYYVFRP
jgi:esterase/lipase superfamily enzyme